MDDVILNKLSTIQRCLTRIREEFDGNETTFKKNFTKQDSVILNLQRACEACIDISNVLIRQQRLGIPQSARDSFELIEKAGVISSDLSGKLKRMVGLKNIAVHDYQALNLDIVVAVVQKHLVDFEEFSAVIAQSES